MVRPFRSETERYGGEYSKSGEYIYDRPFLWGSKRTGPDLQRVGGKYSDSWHFNHMYSPESTSSGSIMPSYRWLITDELDTRHIEKKMEVLVQLGTPYTEEDIANARTSMQEQAKQIVENLYGDPDFVRTYEGEMAYAEENNLPFVKMEDREIVAMIAYLQRLGTDIRLESSNDGDEVTFND